MIGPRFLIRHVSEFLTIGRPIGLCISGDRTPELEHGAMWEIEHIRLLPLRTQQAVFCRANGAV
jgi:hypothetical protein